jgi:hypothetical protein
MELCAYFKTTFLDILQSYRMMLRTVSPIKIMLFESRTYSFNSSMFVGIENITEKFIITALLELKCGTHISLVSLY